MSFVDKSLTCRDCGAEFTFTAGEQEFYQQKGFTNEPTRCTTCRRARKAQRTEGGADRGYSNDRRGNDRGYGNGGNDRFYSSGGSYGGNSYDGGFNSRERVSHETVCSQCGRATTVPFVPRGDRPVYCADCFAQQRGASRGPSRGGYNRF